MSALQKMDIFPPLKWLDQQNTAQTHHFVAGDANYLIRQQARYSLSILDALRNLRVNACTEQSECAYQNDKKEYVKLLTIRKNSGAWDRPRRRR